MNNLLPHPAETHASRRHPELIVSVRYAYFPLLGTVETEDLGTSTAHTLRRKRLGDRPGVAMKDERSH